jgi:hypothetical protein
MNTPPPLSEQHEHYCQELMTAIWDAVGASQNKLSAHDVVGILEIVRMKIGFDMNVRAAQEKLNRMRQDNKPSGLLDAGGFPVD